MGWTVAEYLDAPDWFITAIVVKINAEARLADERKPAEPGRL